MFRSPSDSNGRKQDVILCQRKKLIEPPIRWQKELRLAPAYLLLLIWIFFTVVLLAWVVLASFSTTKEIFANNLLSSAFHWENYEKAWVNSDVSTLFFNSLFYSLSSVFLLVLVCAPADYALSRFTLEGEVKSCSPYDSGHINDTFLVEAGINYILQRTNSEIFKKPRELMENVDLVCHFMTEEIKKQGGNPERESLQIIKTVADQLPKEVALRSKVSSRQQVYCSVRARLAGACPNFRPILH